MHGKHEQKTPKQTPPANAQWAAKQSGTGRARSSGLACGALKDPRIFVSNAPHSIDQRQASGEPHSSRLTMTLHWCVVDSPESKSDGISIPAPSDGKSSPLVETTSPSPVALNIPLCGVGWAQGARDWVEGESGRNHWASTPRGPHH